jgi:hypothetical protein
MLIDKNGALKPVLKILTDYPRDDLAHDEVHQALVTACVRQGVAPANLDVGAVPGMDTVVAGFKTAQLALNSRLGFGHVIHTNCAPRKNLQSVRSQGEKIVVGLTKSGVALLMVNAGYALAPFRGLAQAGEVAFFRTSVPDSGSQFRSRDFFPDAMAELAAHLVAYAKKNGAAKVGRALASKKRGDILKGLPWLGAPLEVSSIPRWPAGAVIYVDNFGNIKLNFRHEDLQKHYKPGEMMAVSLGGFVCDAVMGKEGFSQGEGMLALTSGSSGWMENGQKKFFTEIFLRGGSAATHFDAFEPGNPATIMREADLQHVMNILRKADRRTAERLDLHNISEARIIKLLARAKLIRDGYDTTALAKTLKKGDLLKKLA